MGSGHANRPCQLTHREALAILSAAAPAWASELAPTHILDPGMSRKLMENNGVTLQWIDWDRRGIAWADDIDSISVAGRVAMVDDGDTIDSGGGDATLSVAAGVSAGVFLPAITAAVSNGGASAIAVAGTCVDSATFAVTSGVISGIELS